MYTLVLVIYLATGQSDGGTSVATQTIQGFSSEASCTQEAQKNVSKLIAPKIPKGGMIGTDWLVNHVQWSCFKVS